MKSNSYEAQLTGEELAEVHALLRTPGIDLEEAESLVPPWKIGRLAGKRVSHQTLSKICRRLGAESRATEVKMSAMMLEAAANKLKKEPGFSEKSSEILDQICSELGQEILGETLEKLNTQEKVAASKVLLKRHDQFLAEAKFKRETCKVFMDWYEDERARRILESREDNAAKLQQLGKLIYGEEW